MVYSYLYCDMTACIIGPLKEYIYVKLFMYVLENQIALRGRTPRP